MIEPTIENTKLHYNPDGDAIVLMTVDGNKFLSVCSKERVERFPQKDIHQQIINDYLLRELCRNHV